MVGCQKVMDCVAVGQKVVECMAVGQKGLECLAADHKGVECLAVDIMSGRVPESSGLSGSRT